MEEIIKRLKCDKCNKKVQASNNYLDTRFYCMNCGRNLGCFNIKKSTATAPSKEETKSK